MSDPTEKALEAIKAMGLTHDEQQIRDALRCCNNDPQEAVQLLLPGSPASETPLGLIEGYKDVGPPRYAHEISQDSRDSYDVDMRDTERHPSPGGDSDRDSTTVSYSLEENTIQDLDEEIGERRGGEDGKGMAPDDDDEEFREIGRSYHVYGQHVGEVGGGGERGMRHEGLPPRYEDIVDDNQGDPRATPPLPPHHHHEEKIATPTPGEMSVGGEGGMSSSIEFPLTHYYELEGRVHTEQWSIPYKRDESLAICMLAATRMILEGERMSASAV